MATNEKKRVTYLGQVFDNKLFAGLIIVLTLVFIYTGSLKVFGDWSSYYDPWSAKGTANWCFYTALIMLLVIFLVPVFNKQDVLARRTQAAEDAKKLKKVDDSGYYEGQPIYYLGPLSDGRRVEATYKHEHESAAGLLVISIDGVSWETARPDQVFPR